MGDLVLIKNESCSRRNFAMHQAEKMFAKEEWTGSNWKEYKKAIDEGGGGEETIENKAETYRQNKPYVILYLYFLHMHTQH